MGVRIGTADARLAPGCAGPAGRPRKSAVSPFGGGRGTGPGDVPPDLHPAPGAQPGADDDLVARGPHLLDRLQGGGDELRLAAAFARRGRFVRAAADVAVGHGLELLDDIALVGEAMAEEVREERRRAAGDCDCRIHDAVSIVPVVGNGGDAPSPGHPAAAPLAARLALSAARGVSAMPGTADGGPATRVAGGGWGRSQHCGPTSGVLRCNQRSGAPEATGRRASGRRLYRRPDGRRGSADCLMRARQLRFRSSRPLTPPVGAITAWSVDLEGRDYEGAYKERLTGGYRPAGCVGSTVAAAFTPSAARPKRPHGR